MFYTTLVQIFNAFLLYLLSEKAVSLFKRTEFPCPDVTEKMGDRSAMTWAVSFKICCFHKASSFVVIF